MRVISVCSGAGGKDLGFHRAGFRTVALCEFDPWRQRLLARNFPGVPCWPDLAELDPGELPEADVLIGGTPCQDLSTAGRRAGLDGERSGLFWHYMRIRNALGIPWAVWENVEGALTSNAGLDFACVLGAFVGADVVAPAGGWPGAGVAAGPWGGCVWRVLDAQHFGVPQRRRRVFVVGHLGGPCPPEVLLEPAGGSGDLETGERAWTDFAGPVGGGAHGAGRRTIDDDNYVAPALVKRYAKGTDSDATDAFVVNALDQRRGGADDNEAQAGHLVPALTSRSSRGKPTPLAPGHNGADEHIVAAPLTRGSSGPGVSEPGRRQEDDVNLVAFNLRGREGGSQAEPTKLASVRAASGGSSRTYVGAPADADGVRAADGLAGRMDGPGVTLYNPHRTLQKDGSVLEGFKPDEIHDALHKPTGNKQPFIVGQSASGPASAFDPAPDGRRYSACGDGVVAHVAEWIGRRLRATAFNIDDRSAAR